MEIHFPDINNSYYPKKNYADRYSTGIPTLRYDTVSFGALKKSFFKGLDLAVVERFKAPIEKFNSNENFQKWCKAKIKSDFLQKDFGGRQEETVFQRKAMINEWSNYVLKENGCYSSAAALLILAAATKGLSPENDKLPPVLNKGILADCISEIDLNLEKDKKYSFDLNKMYQHKLQSFYVDSYSTDETDTKWVVIPSKKHDPQNFEKNVDKLKTLSHNNWCTKTYNAEPYLAQGDFHVYLEEGKPKIGIRFVGNKVQEIQGEMNNSKIPYEYFEIVNDYIQKNNFKLSKFTKQEIKEIGIEKEKINKIKADLKDAIENNDAEQIYKYFGYNPKVEKDGSITLSSYRPPEICLKHLDFDENKLFEKVKRIEGEAYFGNSRLTSLKNLEYVGGKIDIYNSSIKSLGNLKVVRGYLVHNYKINVLESNLEFINGIKIKELANACQENPKDYEKIFNLCNIQAKKDKDGFLTISAYHEPIENILTFEQLGIDENELLKNVKKIEGDAKFSGPLNSLGNLEYIGGSAIFSTPEITSLGKLQVIGGDAFFRNKKSKLTSLENLESIGGDVYFGPSNLSSLGNLKTIGGDAHFGYSELTSLGNLKCISGNAYFDYSPITDIGNLKHVGEMVYLKHSCIKPSDIKHLNRSHTNMYYFLHSLWDSYPYQ